MVTPYTDSATPMDDPVTWFLRVDDTRIRGPVPLATLREWAEEGSITAEDEVSADARVWQPAATLPALAMEWVADLGGGHTYGPINVQAARNLVERGILKQDSVLRRRPMRSALAAPSHVPAVAPAAPRAPIMTGNGDENRIGRLEYELRAMHAELARLQSHPVPTAEPTARGLTATNQPTTVAIDTLYDKVERTEKMLEHLVASRHEIEVHDAYPLAPHPRNLPVAPRRLPRAPLIDDRIYAQEDAEEMRELARTRRFHVQTFRWNIINSSMVIGTGVIVGAIGFMLENDPVSYTGLVLAFLGVTYFGIAMLLLLGRKVAAWAHLVIVRDPANNEDGQPLRGALNITFYWFNRQFRGRPPE